MEAASSPFGRLRGGERWVNRNRQIVDDAPKQRFDASTVPLACQAAAKDADAAMKLLQPLVIAAVEHRIADAFTHAQLAGALVRGNPRVPLAKTGCV